MQIDTTTPAGGRPAWVKPEAGRSELERLIEAFMRSALDDSDAARPPALTLRVSPGLGKTGTTLRLLARHGTALLARGCVLIYMPTLELADRAFDELRAQAPALPSIVMRGRHAKRPDGGGPMCRKSDLVRNAERLVPSVTRAFCREGGVAAACAVGCRYLAQHEHPRPRIIFLAHAYLGGGSPLDPDMPVALRVIDEQFWPSLIRESEVPVDMFMRPMTAQLSAELADAHRRARHAILEGLQTGAPLRDYVRAAGVDAETLSSLSEAEEKARADLHLNPSLSPDLVQWRLDMFDRTSFFASETRERIFALLASGDAGACGRISLGSEGSGDGRRDVIRVHDLMECPRDAPLLMLDADADEEIMQQLIPWGRFVRIDVPPVAEVVQVGDRTVSNAWLAGPDGASRRRAVADIVRREVERTDGRVLVVATKKTLATLHEDAGHPPGGDDDLRRPLHGAIPRWFGPSTRGVNDFSDCATVVVVGRLQPPVDHLERQARALFGDDDDPLDLLGAAPLAEGEALRLMSDGTVVPAKLQTHRDPRVARVLHQIREAASNQAIARLRLLSPDRPKRVVVVGSLPLPDLPVTRVTSFEALAAGLEREPDPAGFRRLQAALTTQGGRLVSGTRLSAGGLAEDLPWAWRTVPAAERFRRGRSTPDMLALAARVCARNGWPMVAVWLKRDLGSKLIPAAVFCRGRESALDIAQGLWPGFAASLDLP